MWLERRAWGAGGRGPRWQVGPNVVAWHSSPAQNFATCVVRQETAGLGCEPVQRLRDQGLFPALALGATPTLNFTLPYRCWVRSPWVHNILVMGYGGLTSLFNLVVLAWALRAMRSLRAQEKVPDPRACRDSVTVLGLTMLLGTTWALAFFSFGVFLLPQLFLFTIFNSLYGRAHEQCGGNPRGCIWWQVDVYPKRASGQGGESWAEIQLRCQVGVGLLLPMGRSVSF